MRLLIIFVLMLSNSFASEATDIKNLVINKGNAIFRFVS